MTECEIEFFDNFQRNALEAKRMMLILDYDFEVFTPPCDPGAERFAAKAKLKVDINEVLPYLNATLRGAVYNPASPALTWKKGGHSLAFHPYEIAISNMEDRQAAEKEIEGLIDLVNRTWERREEIDPDFETHQRPTHMAVYKLLPLTNCKACGEPTCYTFALKLIASQKSLSECPALSDPDHQKNYADLHNMLPEVPETG